MQQTYHDCLVIVRVWFVLMRIARMQGLPCVMMYVKMRVPGEGVVLVEMQMGMLAMQVIKHPETDQYQHEPDQRFRKFTQLHRDSHTQEQDRTTDNQ